MSTNDASGVAGYEYGPAKTEWLVAEMEKVDKASSEVYSEKEKEKMKKLLKTRHFNAVNEAAGLESTASKKQKRAAKAAKRSEDGDEDDDGVDHARINYHKLCTVVCATGNDFAYAKEQLQFSKEGSPVGARFYGQDLAHGCRPGGMAPNGGKTGAYWVFIRDGATQSDAATPICVYLKKDIHGKETDGPFSLCIPEGQKWFTVANLKPSEWEENEKDPYGQKFCEKHPHGVFKFINPPGDDAPKDAPNVAKAAKPAKKGAAAAPAAAPAPAPAPAPVMTDAEKEKASKGWKVRYAQDTP